jgi:brefeldin A-resistance guanine nucleotide exchange factor 1
MSSSGYLVPPSKDPEKAELWTETWKRIDRFLPELRGELALEEEEEAKPVDAEVSKVEVEAEAPKLEGGKA